MRLQGCDPRQGLPKPRQQWVANRQVAGHSTPTQMFYAKQGIVTEEMAFVAAREQMPVEFVRSEVGVILEIQPLVFPFIKILSACFGLFRLAVHMRHVQQGA